MDKAVIYIHGKGGNAEEAIHYKPLFSNCDVIGLDYTAQFPWEAKEEFPLLFNSIYRNYKTVEVIANSIGAYFAINALSNQQIENIEISVEDLIPENFNSAEAIYALVQRLKDEE